MKSRLDDAASTITRRGRRQTESLAGPLISSVIDDINHGSLELPENLSRLIPNLVPWCDGLNDLQLSPENLEFQDALTYAVAPLQVNIKSLAEIVGVKPITLSRWLRGETVPSRKSTAALHEIARLAGLPGSVLASDHHPHMKGLSDKLDWDCIPPVYRTRNARTKIASVRSRLTPQDYALPKDAQRERIKSLFDDVELEQKVGRDRHELRKRNRIDRSRFSEILSQDLAGWAQHLRSKGRSEETVNAYINAAEGLLGHGLSDSAPSELRLETSSVRLTHIASPRLWHDHWTLKEANGKKATGNDDFRIHRSTVERLKSIQSLFNPSGGYIQGHSDLVDALREMDLGHFSGGSPDDRESTALNRVVEELRRLRHDWTRRSRAPTRGRDEISDLLEKPDPIIAVREMIVVQRKTAVHRGREGRRRNSKRLYATAMRLLIVVQLLAQTALRIGMVSQLTVGSDPNKHLFLRVNRPPLLRIPERMFKNEGSGVFRDGPYERELEDCFGIMGDIEEYMSLARPVLLGGVDSDLLFPAEGGKQLMTNNLRGSIAWLSSVAIGANAPPEQRRIRLASLRAHHFRDILASQILHDSDYDYALAADAIHVTEKTCRDYYAFDTPGMRRDRLQGAIRDMGKVGDDQYCYGVFTEPCDPGEAKERKTKPMRGRLREGAVSYVFGERRVLASRTRRPFSRSAPSGPTYR